MVRVRPRGLLKVVLRELPPSRNLFTPLLKRLENIVTIVWGYVVDEDGNPVAGARVSIGEVSTTTDSQGYYVLRIKGRSKSYDVVVSAAGYETCEGTLELKAGGRRRVDFTLSKSECLIATAAYGGRLAWPVQFLRGFRGRLVLSTGPVERLWKCLTPFIIRGARL